MDMKYVVSWKQNGEVCRSEFYEDAQNMADKFEAVSRTAGCSDVKECHAYIHYEEIETAE